MEEWMEVTGNMLKIRAPEELDHHSAEHIRRESDEILARNNIRQIVFDFQKTVFMDSSGIGVIMGRYRNIRLTGGTVKAVHVGRTGGEDPAGFRHPQSHRNRKRSCRKTAGQRIGGIKPWKTPMK